jgi:hypothetical protein
LHSLGDDRFRLTGLGVDREITGFSAAEAAADELAESVERGEG